MGRCRLVALGYLEMASDAARVQARETATDPEASPDARCAALALLRGSGDLADAAAVVAAAALELGSGDDAVIIAAAATSLGALPAPLLPAAILRKDIASALRRVLTAETTPAAREAAVGGVARAARGAWLALEVHSDLGASVVDACWLTHPTYANEFFEGASDVQRFRADGRDAALDVLTTLAEVACDLDAPGRLAGATCAALEACLCRSSVAQELEAIRSPLTRQARARSPRAPRLFHRFSRAPRFCARGDAARRRGATLRARSRQSRARGEAPGAPRAPGAAERARRALRLWRRRKHARALAARFAHSRAPARHPRRARAVVFPRVCVYVSETDCGDRAKCSSTACTARSARTRCASTSMVAEVQEAAAAG